MAHFWKKSSDDWCHICGTRQQRNVEIDYPGNAEHEILGKGGERSTNSKSRFLRVCADCGETIVRIGRGAMKEDVRNNPALVTAQIPGFSPDFKPDVN
jgi:hypothetical protein